MIEDFISDQLKYHTIKHDIQFWEKSYEILRYAESGIYAFQLIYNDNRQVVLVKPLNWINVVSKQHTFGKLWSYDGGKEFKYSSDETLKLDLQKLRHLKIDKIWE